MKLPNDIQLRYGVKSFDELIHLKSDEKNVQTKAVSASVPKVVNITVDECKNLCFASGLEYAEGYEKRVIERVVTTEAVDRDGDIVRCHGVDNKTYRTNPVVLFAHNRSGLPVGKSIKEWIDETIKGWISWDLYFNDDVDTTGWSDLTFRFVKSGAMPAGSMGFLPLETKWNHTPKERADLGMGDYGVEYLRTEKLEHSACSVPANQEALARHLKSLDKSMLLKEFGKGDVDAIKKVNALDENLIDVFNEVLFGKNKTVSVPSAPVDTDNKSVVVNMNLDVSLLKEVNEEIKKLGDQIKAFNDKVESIQKSITDNVNSVMARLDKMPSNINHKTESIYDRSDIESILKL